jgi:hypothetical protein
MAVNFPVGDKEFVAHAGAYHKFMLGLKWVCITLGSMIVFLTMWFASSAGFWAGLITGGLIAAVGVYAMNHGLSHSSESDNANAVDVEVSG